MHKKHIIPAVIAIMTALSVAGCGSTSTNQGITGTQTPSVSVQPQQGAPDVEADFDDHEDAQDVSAPSVQGNSLEREDGTTKGIPAVGDIYEDIYDAVIEGRTYYFEDGAAEINRYDVIGIAKSSMLPESGYVSLNGERLPRMETCVEGLFPYYESDTGISYALTEDDQYPNDGNICLGRILAYLVMAQREGYWTKYYDGDYYIYEDGGYELVLDVCPSWSAAHSGYGIDLILHRASPQ